MNDKNESDHRAGEATPQSDIVKVAPDSDFGLYDSSWTEGQWRELLESLVDQEMASWQDVAALVLGHLNPPQVGTSLASSEGFKRNYGKGETMRRVIDWAYSQNGACEDCGTRLELQADHVVPREAFDDPLDADLIENIMFRCRRCNVVRRPSHVLGGQTHLTAEAALMWILLVIRPRTLEDFIRLCRVYGMTMAYVRMQEAWAMAHWLAKDNPPRYGIEDDVNCWYCILQWPNGAITRNDAGSPIPDGAACLYESVKGDHHLSFIAEEEDEGRNKLFDFPIAFIPFSSYELGDLPPYALAIRYSRPRVKGGKQVVAPLPPTGLKMGDHVIHRPDEELLLEYEDRSGYRKRTKAPKASKQGKILTGPLRFCELTLRRATE